MRNLVPNACECQAGLCLTDEIGAIKWSPPTAKGHGAAKRFNADTGEDGRGWNLNNLGNGICE